MAWQTSSRVWQHVKGGSLNQNDRLMLLALAEKSDKDGICWPWFDTSYETLADMLGITRRSAIRIIEGLCRAGQVVKIEATGRGKSNYYLVTAGLEPAEIDNHLAQIRSKRDDVDGSGTAEKSDTGDTLSIIKGDTGDTLLETKRVTQESPFTEKSDTGVTILTKKSDTGVTPPGLKESGLKESGYSPNGEGGLSPPASSKKSRASPKVELIPETPEQELVFRKWNQNRDAQGRSQQKYFRTIQQKQKCQQAGERLGLDLLGKKLDQVLGNGATSFDHLVNYIAKVNSNGSSHEQQPQSQHRGKHRPKSWASRQRERDPVPT